MCAIDITGQDISLECVLESQNVAVDLEASHCVALPRLDACIAALLTEPKHLRGDLGVLFQAYIENCQVRRVFPKGRAIAPNGCQDLNRGANLTQPSLLELTLEAYTYDVLQKFIEWIELVLSAIPP